MNAYRGGAVSVSEPPSTSQPVVKPEFCIEDNGMTAVAEMPKPLVAPTEGKSQKPKPPKGKVETLKGSGGVPLSTALPSTSQPQTKMGTNLYDVQWSEEEQVILEQGLRTYTQERYASLWRYIKCASHLPAKGVRDVALRVRWMSRSKQTISKKRKTTGAKELLANETGNGTTTNANGPTNNKAKGKGKASGGSGSNSNNSHLNASVIPSAPAVGRPHSQQGKPRSVFAMPMPIAPGVIGSSPGAPAIAGIAVGTMGMVPPHARGVGGHIIGGQMHYGPPGSGAIGGGMGTGVLPGPPGYVGQPVPYQNGMHPNQPGYPTMHPIPIGMPHPRGKMPIGVPGHVLHVPPPCGPLGGELLEHGGTAITSGPGAIGKKLHDELVANAAVVQKLRDDDLLSENNGGVGQTESRTKLTPEQRLELLAEMRDRIVDVMETMRVTQGIMQRMPQLPVQLNLNLANVLLPPSKRNISTTKKGAPTKLNGKKTAGKTAGKPKPDAKAGAKGAGKGKGKGKK